MVTWNWREASGVVSQTLPSLMYEMESAAAGPATTSESATASTAAVRSLIGGLLRFRSVTAPSIPRAEPPRIEAIPNQTPDILRPIPQLFPPLTGGGAAEPVLDSERRPTQGGNVVGVAQ